MYYLMIFIGAFVGTIIGRVLAESYVRWNNSPMRKVKRAMKVWEKDVDKMSNDEVSRRMQEFYEWKEAIDDDWK